MFSSWERARRWVLSTEHGSKAATHHLWVFNAPILYREIWWKLVELCRAGSVLTANVCTAVTKQATGASAMC
jgi:hypothetical protein